MSGRRLAPGGRRGAVIDVARRMHRAGLVVGTVGNVSARTGRDGFLITPSRSPYAALRRRDLVRLEDGRRVGGGGATSREWRLHAEVYRARPDVGGVVHTHSPHAVAWSFRARALTLDTEEVEYFSLGAVPVAPHCPAGSAQLAETATAYLGAGKAVLLERHGVVGVGATVEEALTICEVVERQATVALLLAGLPVGADPPVVAAATERG